MSRIGKNPVPVPDKVTVSLDGLTIKVKGPKGELQRTLPDGVSVSQVDNTIVVILSDHGEDLLEHGFINHRTTLHDSSTRVPLLIRLPGGESPRKVQGVTAPPR